MSSDKKQIGKILLKRRLISADELQKELDGQAKAGDGVPLASRLAAHGVVPEVDVLKALSEQFGVPGIDLTQLAIPIEYLELVPREVAESSRLLPVHVRPDQVFLAMADPSDKRVIDEIEFVTGRKVYPYVAMTTTLEKTIRDAYDAKESNATFYAAPDAPAATLERLGIERKPIPTPQAPTVAAKAPTAVVVDERVAQAARTNEFTTGDFGNLGDEVSRVEMLTDEIRNAAGMVPSKAGGSGKRILVVDDEEDIRKLVRRLLTAKGHHVLEADRGLLALRIVKEEVPDLILLDAMLPELHGFDIARRIKGSEKYGRIPVLMMSAIYRGWRIAEDLKTSYGIEDYIEKPFRVADLMTKVGALLDRIEGAQKPNDPEAVNRAAAKFLEEGIGAYKGGDVAKAIDLLKKGIAVDPLAYRLRYHLALIYGKHGQIFDGITELERAVDLNPKHFPALKNLAVLYEQAGFRHKAVEMWERCLHLAPDPATRESIKAHLLDLL